jgi:hypothetical protein
MACKDCNNECNQGRKCPVSYSSTYLALVLAAAVLLTASLSIILSK